MTLRQLAHPASLMTTAMPFPNLMQQKDSVTLLVNFINVFYRWLSLVGKKREISQSIFIRILKVLVKQVLKHSLFLIWLCYYSRTTTSDSLFYFTILFFNILLLLLFSLLPKYLPTLSFSLHVFSASICSPAPLFLQNHPQSTTNHPQSPTISLTNSSTNHPQSTIKSHNLNP